MGGDMFGGTYSRIESFRIIVASRREAYRDKMDSLLSSRSGFELVKNAPLFDEAMDVLPEDPAEVILVDPAGMESELGEWLVGLKKRFPGIIPILLSEEIHPGTCRDYFSSGVMGLLSPDFSPGVLRKAIETVIRGEHWVSRKVAGRMFSEVFGLEKEKETPAADHDLLTRRELEILSLVSRGCRNKEIGEALSISEKTVKTHLTNIFGKLNIQNRLQAALYANRVFPGNNRGHYQAAV